MSLGYCQSCIDNFVEPYYVLVFRLHLIRKSYELRGESVFDSERYKPFIEGTLKHYGKSMEQFKHDVETNVRHSWE